MPTHDPELLRIRGNRFGRFDQGCTSMITSSDICPADPPAILRSVGGLQIMGAPGCPSIVEIRWQQNRIVLQRLAGGGNGNGNGNAGDNNGNGNTGNNNGNGNTASDRGNCYQTDNNGNNDQADESESNNRDWRQLYRCYLPPENAK